MSKKKRRVKKLLKGLGVGAALLGAGKALMNRRDKANQMKEFLATEGGDISNLSSMIPMPFIKPKRGSVLAKPGINRMDLSEVDLDFTAPDTSRFRNMDMGLGPFAAKDGGRARKRKGFAKKKKQAKKMRKK